MRLTFGGRIKKLCENTLLSQDDISPLANYYQVANNCMVSCLTGRTRRSRRITVFGTYHGAPVMILRNI